MYTTLPSLTSWYHSARVPCALHQQRARPPAAACRSRKACAAAASDWSTHGKRSGRKPTKQSCKLSKQTRASRQHVCHAASSNSGHTADIFDIHSADANQLQTALNRAIAAEDYHLAGQVRDRLQSLVGGDSQTADWRQLGVPEWLADRAERMGFRYATGWPNHV